MRMRLALGFGLLASTALAQSPAPKAGTPNLSGAWKLNVQRSDPIEAAIAEAAGSESMKGGGSRERWLPRTNQVSEVERVEMRNWMMSIAERAKAELLTIEQSERDFKAGIGDELRTFYFGREASSQDARGVRRKTKMRWQGQQLVIEETGEDGMKVAHMYTLLPDGRTLIVAYRFAGSHLKKPLDLKLIFDRATAQ